MTGRKGRAIWSAPFGERGAGGIATSISTFSPPLKATSITDGLPRILIAVGVTADESLTYFVTVDGDGTPGIVGIGEVTLDWRYDPKSELWDDVGGAAAAQFGDSDD